MPEGPGPRPSNCSTPTGHRWCEKRRRHFQRARVCEGYIESLENSVGALLFPVSTVCDCKEVSWHCQCSNSWKVVEQWKKQNVESWCPSTCWTNNSPTRVAVSQCPIETLTELILPHFTVDELERRRRLAESQTLSTQLIGS